MRNITATLALLLLFTLPLHSEERPKNLIYMIGDGMGIAQISMLLSEGNYAATQMERAQNVLLIKTRSASALVTDSAAAGTALATGYKTKNGMVGRTIDGVDRASIMEQASRNGIATGLVTTCEIQHATPAAFYAHTDSRNDYSTITRQLALSSINVAIGGGSSYLNDIDIRNLEERGYTYTTQIEQMEQFQGENIMALLWEKHPASIVNGRSIDYLSSATSKALEILSKDDDGFILMVEGSRIDWEGHDNSANGIKQEVLDFERAVKVALDFAEANSSTLVVITADHETGGLSLPKDKGSRLSADGVRYSFSTGYHTGVMVPALLYGAGAESINGVMENSELAQQLIDKLLD